MKISVPLLHPLFPLLRKSNWITEKLRKLVKPRREATREQLRPMAEGAGSSESLAGHEGHSSDGAGKSLMHQTINDRAVVFNVRLHLAL